MQSPSDIKTNYKAEENEKFKLGLLSKFTKLQKKYKPPLPIETPFDLTGLPKYRNFEFAQIIKRDHDHAAIVDFLISGMYRIYLLLHDKQW